MNKLLYRLPSKTVNRIERILLIAQTDFHIRYYGSKLGVLWAFINPFFQILVYYFAFTYLMGTGSQPNFILYLFTGIITWQFFSETSSASIRLFLSKRFILQNIKINKIDFFISLLISKFRGFLVNFGIFIAFSLLFFDPVYSWNLLYLIPVLLGLLLFSIGITFILATLFIFFRDLDHLWSIVLMAGFWAVPIIWDYKIVCQKYPFMLYNPLTTYIINIRQILLENSVPDLEHLYIALIVSSIVAISGYFFMQNSSKKALEFL
jgi:ABC-type polysaccharide/polyol phosphate export permease